MTTVNNNALKFRVFDKVSSEFNLVGYKELGQECSNLNACDFEIYIMVSKGTVIKLTLNYHLKLLDLQCDNWHTVSSGMFTKLGKFKDWLKETRQQIGYRD